MPSTSRAQHGAMAAAAAGDSSLGIPQSVGQEFLDADQGHHFPAPGHPHAIAHAHRLAHALRNGAGVPAGKGKTPHPHPAPPPMPMVP